jgi:hypothetical protein
VLGDLPAGVARTGSANAFTVGGHTITNEAATVKSLILKGAASQTANLQEWQNSAGTVMWNVTGGGRLVGQSGNSGATFDMKTGGGLGVTIQSSFSTQTNDLLQLLNYSSTVLGGRNANAQIYSGSTTPITSSVGGATTAASGNGTTATITTTTATNLAVGDLIVVAGVTPTGYNTTGSVVTAVSNTSPFTVSYANTTTGAQTVAGTVATPAQASVTARSAGTKGLVLKGSGAGHLAFLMEWYNSANSVVGRIDQNGAITAPSLNLLSATASITTENSGGKVIVTRATASATNPGANIGAIYFRDGTTAGTLKLVVRAGTAGAETTILDNIPQT